jgi:hypothetical protein
VSVPAGEAQSPGLGRAEGPFLTAGQLSHTKGWCHSKEFSGPTRCAGRALWFSGGEFEVAELFDVPMGAAIAVFLVLAALDHLLTGTVARRGYVSARRMALRDVWWRVIMV